MSYGICAWPWHIDLLFLLVPSSSSSQPLLRPCLFSYSILSQIRCKFPEKSKYFELKTSHSHFISSPTMLFSAVFFSSLKYVYVEFFEFLAKYNLFSSIDRFEVSTNNYVYVCMYTKHAHTNYAHYPRHHRIWWFYRLTTEMKWKSVEVETCTMRRPTLFIFLFIHIQYNLLEK